MKRLHRLNERNTKEVTYSEALQILSEDDIRDCIKATCAA